MKRERRFERVLEDLIPLSISHLTKLGVFRTANSNDVFTLQLDDQTIKIRYAANLSILRVTTVFRSRVEDDIIAVAETALRYGTAYYFVCPITGKRCKYLYLEDGKFVSRHVLRAPYGSSGDRHTRAESKVVRLTQRLHGRDGLGPARGERKDVAIRQLLRLVELDELPEETQALVERARRARERKPRIQSDPVTASLSKGDMSTVAAQTRARRAGYTSPSLVAAALRLEFDRLRTSQWASVPHPWPHPLPIAFVEDFPRLDVRELKTMWPAAASSWFEALQWPSKAGAAGQQVYIGAELSDPDRAFLLLRFYLDSGSIDEVIQLVHSNHKNPRWLMICPMSGRTSEILYRRKGQLGCRQAHRLVNRSQRARRR